MTVVAMDTVPPRHRPPSHIMTAELTSGENKPLETWNNETRTRLSPNSIHNDFAYNKFKASPYGIVAEMGATETIPLPPSRTSSARGWDHHSEGDRRERPQLQPEAGRRGQELLSRGPSSGGVLSSSTTSRGMFFVSQYCENVAFGSRTARFFRKHAQRSAVGSGSGRRGRAWPKSQLGGFRSFVAPAANGEVAPLAVIRGMPEGRGHDRMQGAQPHDRSRHARLSKGRLNPWKGRRSPRSRFVHQRRWVAQRQREAAVAP
jgi:hypothetical protein